MLPLRCLNTALTGHKLPPTRRFSDGRQARPHGPDDRAVLVVVDFTPLQDIELLAASGYHLRPIMPAGDLTGKREHAKAWERVPTSTSCMNSAHPMKITDRRREARLRGSSKKRQ
jgi:hypothetical protein